MSTNSPWITTFSGRQFFITHATVNDIYIEDIAHGLSNICRYVGQCKTFYSVAEHSVRMAEMCRHSRSMMLIALLHDAPEAYLGDVSSMVKHCLPVYMKMEKYLLGVIFDRYGICLYPEFASDIENVKALDEQIRTPEVHSLFPAHVGWTLSWSEEECNYGKISPWSPKKAEREFIKLFVNSYYIFPGKGG